MVRRPATRYAEWCGAIAVEEVGVRAPWGTLLKGMRVTYFFEGGKEMVVMVGYN